MTSWLFPPGWFGNIPFVQAFTAWATPASGPTIAVVATSATSKYLMRPFI
jgi:hypothetical protein